MARIYSDEEKRTHLDQYRVRGKCKTEYARENDISEATMYNITNILFDFPVDSMEHIV